MRRTLLSLLALTLGVLASLLVACGQDRSNLIPSGDAEALKGRLDRVAAALADGQCEGIGDLVAQAKAAAQDLGGDVDRRLRQRINEGIRALEQEAPQDCQAPTTQETQTETTPTVQTQTETTPTITETLPETQTETVPPTDTTTVPPDGTPTTPTTPTDPGTGGTPGEEVPTP